MTDQPASDGVPPSPFLPADRPQIAPSPFLPGDELPSLAPPSPPAGKTLRVLSRIQIAAIAVSALGLFAGLGSVLVAYFFRDVAFLLHMTGYLFCLAGGGWAVFLLAKAAEALWTWLCKRNFQFTLWWLMAFTFVAALILGGISWVLQAAAREEASRRLQATRTALRTVAGSLALYDAMYGHLPCPVRRATLGRPVELGMPNGTGKPLYSWRAEVAELAQPWCEDSWNLAEPWNSPANRRFAEIPARYCYEGLARGVGSPVAVGASTDTNLLAITGPGTAFGGDGETPRSLAELDGDTILAVEVVNSGLHWMEPGDFDVRTMPQMINARDGRGISSRHPGGFHVLFADQQTWFLSTKVPFAELRKFFTVESAKRHNRRQVLSPYLLARFPSWEETRKSVRASYSLYGGHDSVVDPEFTDADLWQFAPGRNFTVLDFSGTRITGTALGRLRGCSKLWSLRLDATPITGPGLEQLEGLSELQALFLSDTRVDDAGVEYIRGLPHLTTLHLDGTAITDAGLKHLAGMKNLQELSLSRTRIAGSGLVHLAGMSGLTALQLSGTEVGDEALEHLASLESLTSLALHRTRVTVEGAKELRQCLPKCKVHYSGLSSLQPQGDPQ